MDDWREMEVVKVGMGLCSSVIGAEVKRSNDAGGEIFLTYFLLTLFGIDCSSVKKVRYLEQLSPTNSARSDLDPST